MIYYVSSSLGNDTNNGTSPATPWQTTDKVNATPFVSGDSVLFKRGDVFVGNLELYSSSVIYDSYGTGEKPIITLRQRLTGSNLTNSWTLDSQLALDSKLSEHSYNDQDTDADFRNILPAGSIGTSASKIRIMLLSSSLQVGTVKALWIGEQDLSVNEYSMKPETMLHLTFDNGSFTTTVPTSGNKWSDWMDYAFDKDKTYVINLGITGGYTGLEGYGKHYLRISSGASNNAGLASVEDYISNVFACSTASIEVSNGEQKTWSMSMPTNYSRIYFDNIEGGLAPRKENISYKRRWYQDRTNGILYVYSDTNPALQYTNMEVPFLGTNSYTFALYQANNCTVRNLNIQGGYNSMYVVACDNTIIEDCSIGMWAGVFGISIRNLYPTKATCDDGIVRRCTINSGDTIKDDWDRGESKGTEEGIAMNGCNRWQIYNNTFDNWGHTSLYIQNFDNNYPTNDNKIHSNLFLGTTIEYARAFSCDGVGLQCRNNQFYLNYISGMSSTCQFSAKGTKVFANIFNGYTNSPKRTAGLGTPIYLFGGYGFYAEDIYIINNIFANCDEAGIRADNFSKNCVIANNIFYNTGRNSWNYAGGHDLQLIIGRSSDTKEMTIKNNIFYTSSMNEGTPIWYGRKVQGSERLTVAQLNNENGNNGDSISGNLNVNPMFINTNENDFSLEDNSLAISSGINFSDISEDLNKAIGIDSTWPNNVISSSYSNVWNIGPYESSIPPIILKGRKIIIGLIIT